jgi:hypothetical protein
MPDVVICCDAPDNRIIIEQIMPVAKGHKMKTAFALAAALFLANPAHALEAYGGVTLDYALPHSGDAQTLVTALGGITTSSVGPRFGAEVELGVALGAAADYNTRRFNGVVRYDIGSLLVFGQVGLDQYVFESDTENGWNAGLGGEFAISGNIALRGAVVRTFITDGASPDTTTTRFGVAYRF